MDTFTRDCKICGAEFDSIFCLDGGICDEHRDKVMVNGKPVGRIFCDKCFFEYNAGEKEGKSCAFPNCKGKVFRIA